MILAGINLYLLNKYIHNLYRIITYLLVLIYWDTIPMIAGLFHKHYFILILTGHHTILFTQTEVPLKYTINDELSNKIIGSEAGEKESRFGRMSGNVTYRERLENRS